MVLSDRINSYGQQLLRRYGERVHKIALDAGMTCPNRDGSKGRGGCTFCNNDSFSPNGRTPPTLREQLDSGRRAISRRTRATKFLAYFQAYTNTYAGTEKLQALYREVLAEPDIIGLSVGTRPDCVAPEVLDLLADFRAQGYEVVLELGLQSAFDETLRRVNRGHGLAEYAATAKAARQRGIPVCAHLIVGLPGEDESHYHASLDTVLDIGVDGLKLHPLHIVKHTQLAQDWQRGRYTPLGMAEYIRIASDLIERTPEHIAYHRVTGTSPRDILLAPEWASKKWSVLNGIEQELRLRGGRQGRMAGTPFEYKELRHVA